MCFDCQVHGKGTLTYVGGDKYAGEWQDAKKHGEGELIYTNGDRFKGQKESYSVTSGNCLLWLIWYRSMGG